MSELPAMLLVESSLICMLIITAIAVGGQRNLFAAVMLMSIFSLLSASLFVSMDAMDVAFTEAAVGAGISTLLFLAVLAQVGHQEGGRLRGRLPALALCCLCGSLLFIGLWGWLPPYGDPSSPVNAHLSPWYERSTAEDIGIPNVVTAVLASYRGYDTFGEVTVIFTALVAVLMLLGRGKDKSQGSPPKDREESA